MSLPNPFAGLHHLGKAPRFLAGLTADLRLLFTPDLTLICKKPPRDWFVGKAAYFAAATSLAREHMFRVVRQAVKKQLSRRTLWYRFGICYLLLGPVVIFFWIGVFLLHLAAIAECPQLLDRPLTSNALGAVVLVLFTCLLMKARSHRIQSSPAPRYAADTEPPNGSILESSSQV